MKTVILFLIFVVICVSCYAYNYFFTKDNVVYNVDIIITKQYDIRNNMIIHGICCEDNATYVQHKITSKCKLCAMAQ